MGFEIQRRQLRQIQTQKQPVPLDQIIAVQGQNPLAQGIATVGNTLGQVMAQRKAERDQGQKLAELAKLSGQNPGTYEGLDPSTAAAFAMATMKQNQEGKKKILQGTFTDPVTKKVYQPFYDEKNDKIDYQELKGPQVIPPKAGDGTLVQTGVFDENHQPIMVNNKTGKSQTITLPGGTIGKTLTKTQLAPTSTTRSGGEFAATVIPHIQDMKDLIQEADAAGYIGPVAGRVYGQFLTGKVGSTGDPQADYLLGRLRATDALLKTGAMKAHFGNKGGQQMYDHFSELLNSGKQSAAVMNGTLDELTKYMQGYVEAGQGGQLKSISPKAPTTIVPTKVGRFNVQVE